MMHRGWNCLNWVNAKKVMLKAIVELVKGCPKLAGSFPQKALECLNSECVKTQEL